MKMRITIDGEDLKVATEKCPTVVDFSQITYPRSPLEWGPTLLAGTPIPFPRAQDLAESLGDDWRLPTLEELEGLIDRTTTCPAAVAAERENMLPGRYWTSTPLVNSVTNHVWVVDFLRGYVLASGTYGNAFFVRVVRNRKD